MEQYQKDEKTKKSGFKMLEWYAFCVNARLLNSGDEKVKLDRESAISKLSPILTKP